jgi:RNA-binding protein YlmH
VVPDVSVPEQKVRQIRDTVPSLRLDGIVSSGFSISRGKAAEYISAGKCELNYAPCVKGDKQTTEGDVITVRGLGKIRLDAVVGNTKKGRICVEITRFL